METKKAKAEREKKEAIAELLPMLEQADYKVWTVLDHVSKSGMLRVVSAKLILGKNEVIDITYLVARVMPDMWKRDKKLNGLRIGGCGTDVGFELVYNLSSHLFRNADGSYSHEGSYKLKQSWLNL